MHLSLDSDVCRQSNVPFSATEHPPSYVCSVPLRSALLTLMFLSGHASHSSRSLGRTRGHPEGSPRKTERRLTTSLRLNIQWSRISHLVFRHDLLFYYLWFNILMNMNRARHHIPPPFILEALGVVFRHTCFIYYFVSLYDDILNRCVVIPVGMYVVCVANYCLVSASHQTLVQTADSCALII